MILLRDAFRLSVTKLKIRKVRLFVTVIIAALLFSAAIFVVTIIHGTLQSFNTLNVEGLSTKYLVAGNPAVTPDYSNPDAIAFVKAEQKKVIDKKKAEAKRLGIEYDAASEQPWVDEIPNGPSFINSGIPEVVALVDQFYKATELKNTYEDFKIYAKDNGATATYRISAEYSGFGNTQGSKTVIVDGKEIFAASSDYANPYEQKGFKTIESANIRQADDALIQPFTLPNQTLEKDANGAYPALVPYSVAEEALGLKALPKNATSKDKIARIQEVRTNIAGKSLTICYRNDASTQKMQEVIQQKKDIEANKNKKDYIKPSVIYDMPATACGDVVVVKDTRSAEEKKLQAKQDEFARIFGKEDPASKLVTIRIVGVTPDLNTDFSNSIVGILSMVAASSVGSGWIMPTSAVDTNISDVVASMNNTTGYEVMYVAEMQDAATQKQFIEKLSCDTSQLQAIAMVSGSNMAEDPTATLSSACTEQNKFFIFMPYGNNAAALDEFEKGFNKVFNVILIVISVISSVIMMGTIARIIADSRRETAVFRAIGATRLDMSLVYGIYALMMATLVIIVAGLIGWAAAMVFNSHFSPQVTPQAILVFNVTDLSKTFSFYALDIARIAKIAGVVYLATFIGLILPLLSNLRRSPLKDMRDEN
jgi:ABC-type antimicrobial peptide transport system permease subunit